MHTSLTLTCALLMSLVVLSQSTPLCYYQAMDGSVYDLRPMMSMNDFVAGHSGAAELFYFGVCRHATSCDGAACSVFPDRAETTLRGSLDSMEWSEQYTREGKGISLVYEDGVSTCGHNQASRFVVTLLCDENTDALLVGFDSDCSQKQVSVKSRFACPKRNVIHASSNTYSDDWEETEIPTWLPLAIVGTLLGFALVVVCIALSMGAFSDSLSKDEEYIMTQLFLATCTPAATL